MLAGSTDPSLHGLNGVGTALTWAENVSMTIHDCSGLALGRRNGVGRMRFLATYLPTYPGPPRAAVAAEPTYLLLLDGAVGLRRSALNPTQRSGR